MLSCTALVNACIIVCLRKAALSYPKPPLGRPRQSASGIATYERAWAVRAQAWNACSWDCNSHVGVCAWSARVPPGAAEPHPGESARGAAACVLAGASAEPSGRLTRGCALVATPFAVRGWTLQWDFRDLPNPAVWPAHRTGPCFNPPSAPPWSGPASRPRRSKYTNGPTLGYEYTHGKLQLARRCLRLVRAGNPRARIIWAREISARNPAAAFLGDVPLPRSL